MTRYECAVCGAEFKDSIRQGRPPRQFCGRKCSGLARRGWHHAGYRRGPDSVHWKGDAVEVQSGRARAERMYPDAPKACEACGVAKRLERHHKNGNTRDNDRGNIAFLCRRCHMTADGRLAASAARIRIIQPLGAASRVKAP